MVEGFRKYWQNFTIPFILFCSFVSAISKLSQEMKMWTVPIIAGSGLILSIGWIYYVNTRRMRGVIDEKRSYFVYGARARVSSFLFGLCALACFVWVMIPPAPFALPKPSLLIRNDLKQDMMVARVGDFYIIESVFGRVHTIVGSGRFRLRALEEADEQEGDILVLANSAVDINCEFLRPELYKGFYENYDYEVRFVLMSKTGSTGKSTLIPFKKDYLLGEWVHVRFDESGQESHPTDRDLQVEDVQKDVIR